MLIQLIFTSRLKLPASTPEGWAIMSDIVSRARARNARSEITGYVLVGDDWVAQVLEGPRDNVIRTYNRILGNPHHHQIALIDIRVIAQRSFNDCNLGVSDRHHTEMPFNERLAGPGIFNPITFDTILAMARAEAA